MINKLNYTDLSDIKVIGFDLDQTLFPRNEGINQAIRGYNYKKVAEANDIDLSEAKKLFDHAYDIEQLSGSQTLKKLNVANPADVMQQALEKADIVGILTPDPKTKELLDKLSEKYTIDLITGSPHSIAMSKLKQIDIDVNLFENVLTGEKYAKSTGQAFEEWLTRHPELKPNNYIYIGDRVSTDSVMPAQYGIRSILVNCIKDDPDAKGPQEKTLFDIEKYL